MQEPYIDFSPASISPYYKARQRCLSRTTASDDVPKLTIEKANGDKFEPTLVNMNHVQIIDSLVGDDSDFDSVFTKLASKIFGDGIIFYRDGLRQQDQYARMLQRIWKKFGWSALKELMLYSFFLVLKDPHERLGKVPRHLPLLELDLMAFYYEKDGRRLYLYRYQGVQRDDIHVFFMREPKKNGLIDSPAARLLDQKELRAFAYYQYCTSVDKRTRRIMAVEERPDEKPGRNYFSNEIDQYFKEKLEGSSLVVHGLRDPEYQATADGPGRDLYLDQRQSHPSVVESKLANEKQIFKDAGIGPSGPAVTIDSSIPSEGPVLTVQGGYSLKPIPAPSSPDFFPQIAEEWEKAVGKAYGMPREEWAGSQTRFKTDTRLSEKLTDETVKEMGYFLEETMNDLSAKIYGMRGGHEDAPADAPAADTATAKDWDNFTITKSKDYEQSGKTTLVKMGKGKYLLIAGKMPRSGDQATILSKKEYKGITAKAGTSSTQTGQAVPTKPQAAPTKPQAGKPGQPQKQQSQNPRQQQQQPQPQKKKKPEEAAEQAFPSLLSVTTYDDLNMKIKFGKLMKLELESRQDVAEVYNVKTALPFMKPHEPPAERPRSPFLEHDRDAEEIKDLGRMRKKKRRMDTNPMEALGHFFEKPREQRVTKVYGKRKVNLLFNSDDIKEFQSAIHKESYRTLKERSADSQKRKREEAKRREEEKRGTDDL